MFNYSLTHHGAISSTERINFELSISIRLHGIYLFDLHQLITL